MLSLSRKNILINAMNLHSGGGIQVAASFVYELSHLKYKWCDVAVSSEVHREIMSIGVDVNRFTSYYVHDANGVLALFDFYFVKALFRYDVVFTVFGPLYSLIKPKKSVVGFAQPWIIIPDNEIYEKLGFIKKKLVRIKYYIQKKFYFMSDEIIVELEFVKRLLSCYYSNNNICVVNNCVSGVFLRDDQWRPVSYDKQGSSLLLGIVSRDYPHKNLDILTCVGRILDENYNLSVKFLVTLTDEEWQSKNAEFYDYVENIGKVDIQQCPSFYRLLNGVVFPSLLECFSATLVEAMIMEVPVFASDREFVHDVCGVHAIYFEPLNPQDIASKIYAYFSNNNSNVYHELLAAKGHAKKFSNPSVRAKKYIDIVESVNR